MATVKWNKMPLQLWRETLLYGHDEFGKTTAIRFVKKTNKVIRKLERFPEIGFPEPLLKNKKVIYRACHLLPHLKLIYRYYPTSDTVRIVDVWNTRRSPDKLTKRIR